MANHKESFENMEKNRLELFQNDFQLEQRKSYN